MFYHNLLASILEVNCAVLSLLELCLLGLNSTVEVWLQLLQEGCVVNVLHLAVGRQGASSAAVADPRFRRLGT